MMTSEYQYLGRSEALVSPAGYRYYVLLYGKTQPDGATARHTVTVKMRLACNVLSSFYSWATAGYARVNGTDALSWNLKYKPNQEWNTTALTEKGVTYPSWIDLGEGQVEVSTTFGAETSISLTWGYKMQSSNSAGWFPESGVWAEGSTSAVLEAIPGATLPVVSGEGILGQPLTITLEPVDPAYTHSLSYSFGTLSGPIGTGIGTETVWTPPEELARAIPNAPTGELQILCTTFSGERQIGSTRAVAVTVRVPESLGPGISAAWSDSSGLTQPARYLSALAVDADITTCYGAGVRSRVLTLGGKAYSGGILEESGDLELTLTVTDSRGLSAVWQETVTVLAYDKPTLRMDASRWSGPDKTGHADEMGEYAKVTLRGTAFPLEGKAAAVTLTYGGTELEIPLDFGGTQNISAEFQEVRYISAPSAAAMSLTALLTDGSFTAPASMTLSIGYATMDFLRGGKGIALGTTATEEGFRCAMDAAFTGSVRVPEPEESAHAATKGYVDQVAGGIVSPADYIVEVGSEDIWTWRKWNSGYIELEGKKALHSASSLNTSGGIYFAVVGAWTYPFALTELTTVSFGYQTTKSNVWLWGEGVSTTGIVNSYVGRGNSASVSGYPTVRITGKWK